MARAGGLADSDGGWQIRIADLVVVGPNRAGGLCLLGLLGLVLPQAVGYCSIELEGSDMAPNENGKWELVAAHVAKETDSEKLRELVAEFNRVLNKREQLRRQQETKSV